MIMLNATRWGLNLKAVGQEHALGAACLASPPNGTSMSAFLVCGALAGIAGSYRVLFTFDNLRPLASGGIGFLGLLVVLLLSIRLLWVPLITFAFAAILDRQHAPANRALAQVRFVAGGRAPRHAWSYLSSCFRAYSEVFFPQPAADAEDIEMNDESP